MRKTRDFHDWVKSLRPVARTLNLGILHFLSQIKLADDHFIQLTIERVKRLILTHFQQLKSGGQQLGSQLGHVTGLTCDRVAKTGQHWFFEIFDNFAKTKDFPKNN